MIQASGRLHRPISDIPHQGRNPCQGDLNLSQNYGIHPPKADGFKGKAATDEKAEHTRQYVSILNRSPTQPLSLRRIFEIATVLTVKKKLPYCVPICAFSEHGI